MPTKSIAISPFTMPAALAAADPFLNDPEWEVSPNNLEQVEWLARFRRRARLARSMDTIRSHATVQAAEHAAWLEHQGWKAQITQGQSGDIFLAAVLNIAAWWQEPGRAYEENGIHRALVKKGCSLFETTGQHPVVEITTQKPAYNFCFQQVDVAPTTKTELAAHALQMVTRPTRGDVYLDFPMVNLLVRDDARYMIGLHAGENVVTQASEQLRLELNEIGGRASATAEIAVSRGINSSPRVVKLDGPFIVAINHTNAETPDEKVVFAAYCDRDAWGKPTTGHI